MTNYENLTILISFTTLIVSLVVFLNSRKIRLVDEKNSNRLMEIEESNLKHNMAQTELHIQELLVNARKLFLDINLEKLKLSLDDNSDAKEIAEKLTSNSLQEILNAYEIACMKYIDNKVDTGRFKKTYYQEIRQIFANDSYKDFLNKENSFHALKKVNQEWNNLEN